MTKTPNVLIVADSERDANMLYAAGWFAPDPFIFFRVDGKHHAVVNDLEIDRAKKKSPECRIISHSQCLEKLRRNRVKRPGMAAVISLVLREERLRKIFVPPSFPLGLAKDLRNYKIKIRVKKNGVFPEREFKRAEEIKKISAALIMAEVGLAEGIQALRSAKIARDGKLMYHGVPLTSEKLRSIINVAIMQAGGLPSHTIVAGGNQACDPHEQGHGVLRGHQPIILDVFPRSQKTGYFGDITRTVVKGRRPNRSGAFRHGVERARKSRWQKSAPERRARKFTLPCRIILSSKATRPAARTATCTDFFTAPATALVWKSTRRRALR